MSRKITEVFRCGVRELRLGLDALGITPPDLCREADAKLEAIRGYEQSVIDEPEPTLDSSDLDRMGEQVTAVVDYRLRRPEKLREIQKLVATVEQESIAAWDASAAEIENLLREPFDLAAAEMTEAASKLRPFKTQLVKGLSRSFDYDRDRILASPNPADTANYGKLRAAVARINLIKNLMAILHQARSMPAEPEEFGNDHRIMRGFRADLVVAAGAKGIAIGSEPECRFTDLLDQLPGAMMRLQTVDDMWRDYEAQQIQRRAEFAAAHGRPAKAA